MLQNVEIRGIHLKIDDRLQKYVSRKLARIDRYMSRHDRATAHLTVRLKEEKKGDKKCSIAEITLQLPKETIRMSESTVNMYAAIDIVEQKLRHRLHRHKDLFENGKTRRHMFHRFFNKQSNLAYEPVEY